MAAGPAHHYRLRLSRKRLLWRAFRKRRELARVKIDRSAIRAAPLLLCAVVRNEAERLPFFLAHYRALGVGHFLIVSNDSSDGTDEMLRAEADVSLWRTEGSYRESRFGMDWATWLLRRYGAGKWTLTVDADELLVYPDWESRRLPELTRWLDARGHRSFGALMLDLYPKGSPDAAQHAPGQDPTVVLNWFDAHGYWCERRGRHGAVNIVGGVRARAFFAEAPEAAPVLSKVPLVRWSRRFAWFSSTHVLLPTGLNEVWHRPRPTGILLHTKFLPGTGARAREEKARGQQYVKRPEHAAYYDALSTAPDFWSDQSTAYEGAGQLADLGLMQRGDWSGP